MSLQLNEVDFAEGIIRVIKFLTTLENTTKGVNVLNYVEDNDLLDLKIPAVVIGMMTYRSSVSINDGARKQVLKKLVENGNEDDIYAMLKNFSFDPVLMRSIAKMLINESLEIDGEDFRNNLDSEVINEEDLRTNFDSGVDEEDYVLDVEDVFPFASPSCKAVFNAILSVDSSLYNEIILEIKEKNRFGKYPVRVECVGTFEYCIKEYYKTPKDTREEVIECLKDQQVYSEKPADEKKLLKSKNKKGKEEEEEPVPSIYSEDEDFADGLYDSNNYDDDDDKL
jgi:hypothetical protein